MPNQKEREPLMSWVLRTQVLGHSQSRVVFPQDKRPPLELESWIGTVTCSCRRCCSCSRSGGTSARPGSDELRPSWWVSREPQDFAVAAGGRTEQRQRGHVELEWSQWWMQSIWKTCLQDGTWSNSSFISNSPKHTQHLLSYSWLEKRCYSSFPSKKKKKKERSLGGPDT